MRDICPTSPSPANLQVLPASGEKNTPRPSTTSLRGLPSPVPTQTRFGLDGASPGADVVDVRLAGNPHDRRHPPAGHGGPEIPELEVVERVRHGHRGGRR